MWLGLGAVWATLVVAGLFSLSRYSFAPGVRAAPPAQWPTASHLARDPAEPTLVVVAHPRCACTRATLAELARVLSHLEGKLKTYVVFSAEPGADAAWTDSDTVRQARRIPGVDVVLSQDEARLFHGQVSGEAFLFSAAGELVFSGGLTPSRGHEGDNPGKSAVLSYVLDGKTRTHDMPAFGCALEGPQSNPG
ncbi:MAG: RedB protein [Deltaproteobacteria bacterium]|nr:RedB protein [Deltaproteobacteria bacterium]